MHDKVLNILRKTHLHENEVNNFSFKFDNGSGVISITQPNEECSWPDHELELYLSGISKIQILNFSCDKVENNLLDVECNLDNGIYHAVFTIGKYTGEKSWVLDIVFSDLSFKRYPDV